MLKSAPENLAAIRGLAEIHHRRGELGRGARVLQERRSALAKHDPDLEQTVDEISRALSPAQPVVDDGLSFEQASAEFLAALENLPGGLDAALVPIEPIEPQEPAALPELERFLDAIHTYRQKKAV